MSNVIKALLYFNSQTPFLNFYMLGLSAKSHVIEILFTKFQAIGLVFSKQVALRHMKNTSLE